jgi:hypothetical protein
VDAIPVILSEIVRDEGWFMSQYMRSLTCPMALRGTFGAGTPACIPTVVVELNMHDGAEGAFGAWPPACIPNTGSGQFQPLVNFCCQEFSV